MKFIEIRISINSISFLSYLNKFIQFFENFLTNELNFDSVVNY